jgi:hypothetical protein
MRYRKKEETKMTLQELQFELNQINKRIVRRLESLEREVTQTREMMENGTEEWLLGGQLRGWTQGHNAHMMTEITSFMAKRELLSEMIRSTEQANQKKEEVQA